MTQVAAAHSGVPPFIPSFGSPKVDILLEPTSKLHLSLKKDPALDLQKNQPGGFPLPESRYCGKPDPPERKSGVEEGALLVAESPGL